MVDLWFIKLVLDWCLKHQINNKLYKQNRCIYLLKNYIQTKKAGYVAVN
jgi:hypothetical protein